MPGGGLTLPPPPDLLRRGGARTDGFKTGSGRRWRRCAASGRRSRRDAEDAVVMSLDYYNGLMETVHLFYLNLVSALIAS